MSQPVDLDEQRGYQAPSGYHGVMPPSQQAYPFVYGAPPQGFGQAQTSESTSSRHRLILALCSLAVLMISLIAYASVLETWTATYMGVFALIGLGMVCVALVALNFVFHLKR